MSPNCPTPCLETLSAEILRIIVDLLLPWEIKRLSCASKQLRGVCLPSLFRQVQFQFSQAGFEELNALLKSDARHYVASFTYTIPELLKTEILDFNRFKSDILTPDDYVEEAKDMYDAGYGAYDRPPYMVIYDTVRNMCEEQRNIVDNSVDVAVLSSVFGALPRLTEVILSFCATVEGEDWLDLYVAGGMTIAEKSYEYHTRAVSDAIQNSRASASIHTIGLLGFDLPYYDTWDEPDLSSLSESLRELLGSAQVLRLTASKSPLKLLSHCALNLHQLDMCSLVVEHAAVKDFFEANKKSIRSIGLHKVRVASPSRLEGRLAELSPSMLCSMLKVPQSVACRADCGCLRFRKEGLRLLLTDDLQCSAGATMKRRYNEI